MFNIEATVGTSEVVEALVYQRIESLKRELAALQATIRETDSRLESMRESISETYMDAQPPSSDLGALYQTGLFEAWLDWDESKPMRTALLSVSVSVDPNGNRQHVPVKFPTAIGATFAIVFPATDSPPACITDEMMNDFDAATAKQRADSASLYRLSRTLGDHGLSRRLRGELLTQVIEKQDPDMGTMISAIAESRGQKLLE